MNSIRLSKINKISYSSYNYSDYVTLWLETSIPPCGYLYGLWSIKFYFVDHQNSKFYRYINIYNPLYNTINLTLLKEGDYILASKVVLTKENIWDILSTTNNKHIIKILSYHV